MTGAPSSNRISRAVITMMGSVRTSRIAATTMSNTRFMNVRRQFWR